jgi:hypothetical protein
VHHYQMSIYERKQDFYLRQEHEEYFLDASFDVGYVKLYDQRY